MSTTAFALAGLGGFNAHGAGFLAAASESKVMPDLVTATSGQIIVLADWLQGKNLEQSLVIPELEHNTMAQAAIAVCGDPGIFRPAYLEALRRWLTPPFGGNFFETLCNRLFPAQLYVPTRPQSDFATIADVFNNAARIGDRDIGIVFNAYDLKSGQAVLYGNDKARRLWQPKRRNPDATKSVGDLSKTSADEIALAPITAEAVESALWLSLYGFDNLPQPNLIDGAYDRACIVSELHIFDRIFVARPLAQGWVGRNGPPGNWFEVQDWQTEMWFSAGYKAEVAALSQINGLIKAGMISPSSPLKQVELIEIAPETPAGFFNYFVEREKVYERAYEEAAKKFTALGFRPSSFKQARAAG
jgi:hypothetical protein